MLKTSKHINKIVKSLFIFIFLIIAFVFILANGISIKSFKLPNLEVSELYLKLDKKLILNVGEVYIKKANNNEALDFNKIRKQLLELKDYKQAFLFFQQINIKNLKINENELKLYYDSKHLNISNEDIETNIVINLYSNELLAKITNFKYKDLYFYGDLKISKNVSIQGYLHSLNNDLSSKINVINSKNDFSLDIENIEIKDQISALNHIEKYFKPIIKEWLMDRVRFDNFKGSFTFYIKNNKLEKALGDGVFSNVEARYNDKAPKAFAKELKLKLEDLNLSLTSNEVLSSNKLRANKFYLNFDYLLKPNVSINIEANNALYNEEVEKILNAYNIILGIKQLNGKSNANINIKLNNNHTKNILVNVKSNGDFNFKNLNFNANLNVNVNGSNVLITGDAKTKEIEINNAKINLNAISKLANIDIANLKINYEDYFNYNDQANLKLDLNTKILEFPKLNSIINLNNSLVINSTIPDVLKYSKKLQKLKFSNGKLELSSKDNIYFLAINNAIFDFDIYKNNSLNMDINNKYTKDDFNIIIKNNETTIDTKSKLINVIAKNNKITLNLKDLIIDANNLSDDKSSQNVELNLLNSKVVYKNFMFNFKNLNLVKTNNQTIVKSSFTKGGNLSAQIDDNVFKAYIRELKYNTLNEIVNKDVLISGEIDLDAKGNTLEDFEGLINIREAYFANTKNHVNLIAVIESIPSLITFNSPGFDKKGLGVKFGSIEFKNKNGLIDINNVNLLGYTIDCSGKGIINTAANTADITLNIFTLKNTNKIISNIPIVKEIFIGGKDNKIATQLKISGNLDNLNFKTSLAKDIITSPFVLLKNIVTLPKNLIVR